ncbi:hypothetical protein AOC36_03620 [Erysipelothrix larvae]|uniref:Uncharacterized protein n=1 Tax=Erysipelothrix larvae TaxID=1514105 RepID=A0A0X8GZ59_9FIRM|nr:hypothetical protein [Erysipelothrix larvae]AMC93096.1 hypothetical protein AOC36_03620 [Erysipelothrix larvae]
MKDRIRRVINNHQLSCEHTSKYYYILRGFKPLMGAVEIPVKPYADSLDPKENRYILEEDLPNHDAHEFEGFDVWTVTFNLFDDKILDENGQLVDLNPLTLPVRFKNLNIFNEINPLTGIVDNLELDNDDRLDYLKAIGFLK